MRDEYLHEVGSDLASSAEEMSVADVARNMQIAAGPALSLLVVCHVGGKTNSPPRSAYVTPTEGDSVADDMVAPGVPARDEGGFRFPSGGVACVSTLLRRGASCHTCVSARLTRTVPRPRRSARSSGRVTPVRSSIAGRECFMSSPAKHRLLATASSLFGARHLPTLLRGFADFHLRRGYGGRDGGQANHYALATTH